MSLNTVLIISRGTQLIFGENWMYVIVSIAYMSINSIYASSSGLYSVVLSQSWDGRVAIKRSAAAAAAAAAAEFPPATSYCINSIIFCAELWKKQRFLGIFLWSKCRIIWRFYHIVISGVCSCVLVCCWGGHGGSRFGDCYQPYREQTIIAAESYT